LNPEEFVGLSEPIGKRLATEQPELAQQTIISKEGGLLLLNKPYGETSFFVVNQIRRTISIVTGIKWVKVGHAGTLDPLATGLLILGTRGKTKALDQMLGLPKTYKVQMRLGITSASFDLEQPIVAFPLPELSPQQINDVIMSFAGEQMQEPPIYSAIKLNGQPMYLSARRGEETKLASKPITIYKIELHDIALPYVTFSVNCSKGTYIRSLVRDIAERLGTVGVMTALERDTVGEWNIADALSVEEARDLINPTKIPARIIGKRGSKLIDE
jgi:tRNA pseudouridine55 synthase